MDMFHWAMDDLGITLSFILAGSDLPLVFYTNGRKRKKGTLFEALRTMSLLQDLQFFPLVYFAIELQSKKKCRLPQRTTKDNTGLLSFCATHYEGMDQGERMSKFRFMEKRCLSEPLLILKVEKDLIRAKQVVGNVPFEWQKSITSLLNPKLAEPSLRRAILDRTKELQT